MRRSILRNLSGSAAVEMALVTPLLMTVLFGSFELANYFLDDHIVAKAVRDGARYASRQGFSKFTCPSTIDSAVATNIRHVTRTGQITGGSSRLYYWSNDSTVTVSLRCVSNAGGTYVGLYDSMANVPVISVSATVPYSSLFSSIGFKGGSLFLRASSEIPVMGI